MKNDVTEIYCYEFKRFNIEAFNLADDLRFLTAWINSKEEFTKHLQRVIFSVEGYDLDVRGLPQIPSVRLFFQELHRRWPYFFNFTFPFPETYAWYFHIQYLQPVNVIDGEVIRGFLSPEKVGKFWSEWFNNANQKVYDLDINEALYASRQREMIESIQQYLSCNLF